MTEQIQAVQRMQDYIGNHLSEEIGMKQISREAGYSPWFARRLFLQYVGVSPADYLRKLRLRKTVFLLRDEGAKVLDADGRVLFDYRGEVDCESFGLSGAAVYNCQRFIAHQRLKDFTLEVWYAHHRLQFKNLRPRPVKEAIVTIGGVDTSEIDPRTMQSKLVSGLYFAGEVMDIDGPTGGYNLTLAFATARKAVASIR